MRRKYEGSTIQRRHPGMAAPRPEAWRLEETRGAVDGCSCWGCQIIRRAVQAELQGGQRRRPVRLDTGLPLWELEHRPHHAPPTYSGLDTTVVNWDVRTGFDGIANSADNLAETFRQLTEQLRTTLWVSDTAGVYYATSPATEERSRQRADALLASLLTPEQQEAWRTGPSFTVTVPSGNRYRLHANSTFRLGENGEPIASYCLISRWPFLPVADLVASRLLLLQANEELFLRLANKTSMIGEGVTWQGASVGWQPFVWNHG